MSLGDPTLVPEPLYQVIRSWYGQEMRFVMSNEYESFPGARSGENLFQLPGANCYVWFRMDAGHVYAHFLRNAGRKPVADVINPVEKATWFWSNVALHRPKNATQSLLFEGPAGMDTGFVELFCLVYSRVDTKSDAQILESLINEPWALLDGGYNLPESLVAQAVEMVGREHGGGQADPIGLVAKTLADKAERMRAKMPMPPGDVRGLLDPFDVIPQGVRISFTRRGRQVSVTLRTDSEPALVLDHAFDEREIMAYNGWMAILIAIANSPIADDFQRLATISKDLNKGETPGTNRQR